MNITLYFYNTDSHPNLPPGSISVQDFAAFAVAIESCPTEYALLADAAICSSIDFDYISSYRSNVDVLHCGLSLGTRNVLQPLQITSLSWFFLDSKYSRTINWKASADLFIIRKSSLIKMGGFFNAYTSNDYKVMDLAYRILRSGGSVWYDRSLLKNEIPERLLTNNKDIYNEILFARRALHRKAAITMLMYYAFQFTSWIVLWNTWRKVMAVKWKGPLFLRDDQQWSIVSPVKLKEVRRYSAIIPSLNRYDYLPQAIDSLLNQTFPPDEIIVFDQTDVADRKEEIFKKYDPAVVRVIFSDQKGQSNARNKALANTTCDWCLLFDDDSFAHEDMAEQHRKVVEYSEYMVSTGVSLGPGASISDLPYDIEFYHLADVLETGNCFMHKDVWKDAGFFDMAFNKGPGADNDLGTRIHLKGYGIVFNPKAIRIHYKASTGGLRTYGVWWRVKARVTGPYPPPSQTYTVQKYYDEKFWNYLYFRYYLKAGYRQNIGQLLLLWLFSPFKLIASKRGASKLKELSQREGTAGY